VRARLPILVACGLVLGAGLGLLIVPGALKKLVSPATFTNVGKASVGGPFALTDHTGKPVTDADFRGKYMLVSFGFTFCPDVCPAALQLMAAAIDQLGTKGQRVTPLFITIDPERDTAEQLARYVPSFHPRMVGLTGTSAQIAAVAKAYRVYYQKTKDERSSAPYTMDHSTIIYLMDPAGEFVSHFTHATPLATLVANLSKVL
jgi:protein SCO1